MLNTKIISSQNKVFIDQNVEDFRELTEISALAGEKLSVQFIYSDEKENYCPARPICNLILEGEMASFATVRDVRNVPVDRPVVPGKFDSQYLRTTPGIYPDILTPLRYGGAVCPGRNKLRAVWIEMQIPTDYRGTGELKVTLDCPEHRIHTENSLTVKVVRATLPPNDIYFTQWFYCDCLAGYYRVEPWSERHWQIVENFLKCAADRGRNMIYTPLLTPALNVNEPFERVPSQLVDVSVTGGEYSFSFEKLDRWCDLCLKLGFKYFEISHFFDQHKAQHSAKVYGVKDGEYGCLFGWETLSLDPEYTKFLRALITAFIDHMKKRGDDKRCFYHISDEPSLDILEHYKALKNSIGDLLVDYRIMDALSNLEFYTHGAIDIPVPQTDDIPAFVEYGVKDLWVYYACCQLIDVTNCYVAMPAYRTRSLGMQLYKYDIAGFLHWGFNYYYNRSSGDVINPFLDLGGEDWVPAGDTFMVYPGEDGKPQESTRLLTLEEALTDLRAFKLCESLYSKERVIAEIEAILGEEITFRRCAHSEDEMLRIRERINDLIAEAVK